MTQEVAGRRAEIEASLRKAKEEDERLLKKLQATEQLRLDTEAQARRFDERKGRNRRCDKGSSSGSRAPTHRSGEPTYRSRKKQCRTGAVSPPDNVTENVALAALKQLPHLTKPMKNFGCFWKQQRAVASPCGWNLKFASERTLINRKQPQCW